MIIFGSKGRVLDGRAIENLSCQFCGKSELYSFGVGKYFHFFWIPLTFISKKVGLECRHCSKCIYGDEIPSDLAKKLKEEIFNKQFVWRKRFLRSFFFIVVCLLVISHFTDKKLQEDYFKNPMVDDVYVVDVNSLIKDKNDSYPYGVLKIEQVLPDQLEFKVVKFRYSDEYDAEKIIRRENMESDSFYQDDPIYISRKKLNDLNNSDFILAIKRKGHTSSYY